MNLSIDIDNITVFIMSPTIEYKTDLPMARISFDQL